MQAPLNIQVFFRLILVPRIGAGKLMQNIRLLLRFGVFHR